MIFEDLRGMINDTVALFDYESWQKLKKSQFIIIIYILFIFVSPLISYWGYSCFGNMKLLMQQLYVNPGLFTFYDFREASSVVLPKSNSR